MHDSVGVLYTPPPDPICTLSRPKMKVV